MNKKQLVSKFDKLVKSINSYKPVDLKLQGPVVKSYQLLKANRLYLAHCFVEEADNTGIIVKIKALIKMQNCYDHSDNAQSVEDIPNMMAKLRNCPYTWFTRPSDNNVALPSPELKRSAVHTVLTNTMIAIRRNKKHI